VNEAGLPEGKLNHRTSMYVLSVVHMNCP